MIRKLAKYYRGHMLLFVIDMICATLVAASDLMYPLIAREMINKYIPNENLRLIITWSVVLFVMCLVKAALNYFINYYGHVMGARMQEDMRRELFTHIQKLPIPFFDKNKTGIIMSRVVNDLIDITELAHHGPEDLFLSFVMFISSFIVLSTINLYMTLTVFFIVPFIFIFAKSMRRKMSNAFKKSREEIAEVNANLENSLSGIRVTKSYTGTKHEIEKFEVHNRSFQTSRSAAFKVMARFHVGMNISMDMLNVMVLVSGVLFFYYGLIDIGSFLAFFLFVGNILNPVKRFVGFFEQLQEGMTGFERMQEILQEEQETEPENPVDIKKVKGDILFENVCFSYISDDEKHENNVIKDLSLDIKAGDTVALVGPSGGGKTTLCNLIPRFYEVSSGAIKIDGIDIRDMSRETLRSNIGIVAQDVFLFTGNIRENIAYGDLSANEDKIIDAAKNANIHDFIMSLPEGYDSYVGERGVKLSGGQKQRLAIARVFLKNPSILILDEATSALDNATELMIQRSLEKLSKGRTVLVVAHRLSTIRNADEIVVLTDDGIKERGNHETLLQQNGIYAGLHSSIKN